MENEQSRDEDEAQGQTTGDESPEEFKEQVENDPSTAQSPGDDDAERLRGG